MIENTLRNCIAEALSALSIEPDSIELEFSDGVAHGDYSTNVALMHAKKVGKKSHELALEIARELLKNKPTEVESVEVAGPGFINFFLSRSFFSSSLQTIRREGGDFGKGETRKGEKILIEYTNPNPFKEFHIGHLMSNAIGESLSRLLEFSGAEVRRANYQGDVGLHIAKAVWGMMQDAGNFPAESDSLKTKIAFLGNAYTFGSTAYEESDGAKDAILRINKELYEKNNEQVNNLYDAGRRWSLLKFEELYTILGTTFDFYFFESETEKLGRALVREYLEKGIFVESDGAVIFEAEKYDSKLHTRVFITREGVPTYEAKDLPLSKLKFDAYPFDTSIIVTAVEQKEYVKVVLKALEQISPELAEKTLHISHGMLMLPSGKMSSRKGSVVTGESLLREAINESRAKMTKEYEEGVAEMIATDVGVAAIKYSILRQAIGKNVIYDQEKSLSFEGDSGPYLQYSAVRARSVLEKAKREGIVAREVGPEEAYALERLLYRFSSVVEKAEAEHAPHYVTTFLTEIAGEFNSFYAEHMIADASDPFSPYKVLLTEAFLEVMQNGLYILGIRIPEKM
ncbi:MAG: arginine--tRNA ligase [Candidatus Paceibacterota bacterium]